MPADRKEKLDRVISTLQKQFGPKAIGRSSESLKAAVQAISTGFPELDAAIGIGGIPRGRISELIGAPTSGMTTLALTILAEAQAEGAMAAYLDLQRNFDPIYASHFGVLLDRLALVYPYSLGQALDMLPDFVHNEGFKFLICDLPLPAQQEGDVGRKLTSALGRVLAPLSKSHITLLFLTTLIPTIRKMNGDLPYYPRQASLPHFTSLRLLLQKERWLYKQRDVQGYEIRAVVIKNKLAVPGKEALLAIHFHSMGQGVGL